MSENSRPNPDFLDMGDEAQIRNARRRKRPVLGADDNGLTADANAAIDTYGYTAPHGTEEDQS
jgi:hypothetical protein